MVEKIGAYAKALAAFVVAAYTGYQGARLGISPAGESVTLEEWVGVIANAITMAFAVWAIPNTAAKAE